MYRVVFIFLGFAQLCSAWAEPRIADAYRSESGDVLFRVEFEKRPVGLPAGMRETRYETVYPEGWYTQHHVGAAEAFRLSLVDEEEKCRSLRGGMLISFRVKTTDWNVKLKAFCEYQVDSPSGRVSSEMSIGNDYTSLDLVRDEQLVKSLNDDLISGRLQLIASPLLRELLFAGTTPHGETYIIDSALIPTGGVRVTATRVTSTKELEDLGEVKWEGDARSHEDVFRLSNGEAIVALRFPQQAPTPKGAGTLRRGEQAIDMKVLRYFHPVQLATDFGIDPTRYLPPRTHIPCADFLVPPQM